MSVLRSGFLGGAGLGSLMIAWPTPRGGLKPTTSAGSASRRTEEAGRRFGSALERAYAIAAGSSTRRALLGVFPD